MYATRFSGLGGILAKFILDLWLILRVYAIWGRDQRVLIFLGTCFLGNVCLACVIVGISLGSLKTTPPYGPRLPGMTGCIVMSNTADLWIVFVSSLIFEVVVFVFTVVRAVVHARAGFVDRDTPLFSHLYRTGVVYFLVMALTMAFMSSTALTPLQDIVLPGQFLCAFVSTVCARMMLGIRAVIKGEDHFSALRPSDIHISNFYLTPLSMASVRAPGERRTVDVSGLPGNAPRDTAPASPPVVNGLDTPPEPPDSWA
ncbi:hypothetical protein K439DRAFT_1620271 [Ramaria rubella]|nr:hypothetical protein K439DRAFT_1620271 [Ramaria rubella]